MAFPQTKAIITRWNSQKLPEEAEILRPSSLKKAEHAAPTTPDVSTARGTKEYRRERLA